MERRSPRLPGYDYAAAATTFVTFCARRRGTVFGRVVEEAVILNRLGRVVRRCLDAIPSPTAPLCRRPS